MNIQQALRKRKELGEKISLLEERVQKDFLVSEGRPLYFEAKYQEMIKEIESLRLDSLNLKLKIDVANHKVVNEASVAILLAGRDKIVGSLAFYQSLKAQNVDTYRYHRGENVPVPNRRIPEVELDQIIDRLVAERRRADDQICELNATIQVA